MTLEAPPLARFGRSLLSASHSAYMLRVDAAQNVLARRIRSSIPTAQVRWRYRLVADGLAVVVPAGL